MKKQRKTVGKQPSFNKKAASFIQRNYFLLIFAACVGFVGLVAFYKLFIAKPSYVYAKVKVGQGYWWASTQRPSLWFVKAIQNAQEQLDLTGKPTAKVLGVVYYPYLGSGQYDVYVTLKLKVSKVGNKGTYNFNRETIGVSSPIDLEFPNTQFSGTIVALSEQPIKEQYEEKVIYLSKKYAYPWEYDQIQVGDSLSNGSNTIFEVLEKAKGESNEVLLSDLGKLTSSNTETYRYIIVKARVRVKKEDGQNIFGEEVILSPGRTLSVTTNSLTFTDYVVTKVE